MIANKVFVFHVLLSLLPHTTAALALWLGLAGLVISGAFWLAGAMFTRTIIALLALSAGGIIGMKMPAWCGWSVDDMGTAVAGAMLLGFIGFALHRLWIGVWLGAVLTCWTTLAGAAVRHSNQAWTWPVIERNATLMGYLHNVWNSLPVEFVHVVIVSACVSVVAGIALSAVTPRHSQRSEKPAAEDYIDGDGRFTPANALAEPMVGKFLMYLAAERGLAENSDPCLPP